MKKIYTFLLTIAIGAFSYGQITISALNSPYTQNFDGMGATGTTFPTDWTGIRASGSGTANQVLAPVVTDGSSTSGAIFNIGTATATERALGSLASGSTVPAFGATFRNTTGALISKISLAGVMEQWRSGTDANVTENLVFSYSLDATSLITGVWTSVPGLNLVEKLITSTTGAAVDGNSAANKTSILSDISLAWANNSNLWIKWSDANEAGSDGAYAIDDFSLTATESSTAPILVINTPAPNTTFVPLSNVTSAITVSNFTVANGSGNGHIHYSVDGGNPIMKYDTNPIVLSGLAAGVHTLTYSLVDNSHALLNPDVSVTVSFTITGISTVTNIAALRAGTLNNYYTLTGTAVVSHVRTPAGTVTVSTTRNQKFIQDATGGVLIDDSAAKITTPFAVGDSMSNVSGQLTNFNGILQLVPLQNQTVVSSGNTLTPQNISIAALNADVNTYESKLISFNNITITGTVLAGVVTPLAAGAVFITNTNYNVFDGTTNGVLRTGFAEANYIGATIPTGAFNATALGNDNVTTANPPVLTPQFIIRNAADFSVTLATSQNDIAGLKVYPNPVSNGVLNIESNLNTERIVTLFDVLGKQVLSTTTSNNTINVAALNSGIYIVKITEDGKTATRKLVIN
jgi:hypothetical protein